MRTTPRIASTLVVLALMAAVASTQAAPIRMTTPDEDPLHPNTETPRHARIPAPAPRLQGTGGIELIDPPVIPCDYSIRFDDVAGAPPPGTSYDLVLESGNTDFAERFAGQSLAAAGDFDVLSGDPSGPLTLAPGTASANLDVMDYLGNRILSPLGPQGYPSFAAVGEGSFAVLFDEDQSRIGFDVVGADGGTAVVEFFRRDGSRIGAITLAGLGDRTYAFRTTSGAHEIAGFSLWHDDLAGIGIDNLCHDVAGVPGHPPVCDAAVAMPGVLWPPDHRLVPVSVAGVIDPDSDPVAIEIDDVVQDEPVDGRGDGSTCPDARIGADGRLWLRAERDGRGNGRVYIVSFTARDGRGGTCHGTVTVCVPHDQGGACPAGDGPLVHSLGPCGCGARHTAGEDVAAAPERLDLRFLPGSDAGFEYRLPAAGEVSLAIYDLAGRRVAAVDRGAREAGAHRVAWDASRAARGLYFCRLVVNGESLVRRFVVR